MTDPVLVIALLLLAAVLGVAGISKLADRMGSEQSFADFGVPPSLARPLAVALPIAELAAAAAILVGPTMKLGTAGALGLLLIFTAGVGYNVARGQVPDCNCFGDIHTSTTGPKILVRNLALSAVAAYAFWQTQSDEISSVWAALRDGSVLEGVAVIAAALVLSMIVIRGEVGIVGRVRRIGWLRRLVRPAKRRVHGMLTEEGLPLGWNAPRFYYDGLDGEPIELEELLGRGKPVLVVYADPASGESRRLLPEVARWQAEHHSKLTIVVAPQGAVGQGDDRTRAHARKLAEHGLSNVLLHGDGGMESTYRVFGTERAVLIGADRRVASSVASGTDEIRELVESTVKPQVTTASAA